MSEQRKYTAEEKWQAAKTLLASLEWIHMDGDGLCQLICPRCDHVYPNHASDCGIDFLLKME